MNEAERSQTTAAPDAIKAAAGTPQGEERFYYASQWQLIWWKFRRHKLAVAAGVVVLVFYIAAAFAEFLGPYAVDQRFVGYQNAPPSRIRVYDEKTGLRRPFVYGRKRVLDINTFKYTFVPDTETPHPIYFLVRGEEYRLWGLIRTNIHLFGTGTDEAPVFLLGSDRLGRDVFSRTIYGARISLSIGLVGVFLSFILGTLIGGISGYFGGVVDEGIQRLIDFLISLPTIPLWMALSAALPRDWTVVQTYFAITVLLSIIGWSGLARVVRGKVLALREEDFTLAARAAGATEWRIITKHLLPSCASHLVVSITLSIPQVILGETALSFLGLGMQPPAVSWGVLLQRAQDIATIAHQPWQLIPAVAVIITVLMFNFLGDGLRDAADPYSR